MTLAAGTHHVFDLVLTARQYLMLAEEHTDDDDGITRYCYRLAVSPSSTGEQAC